MNPTAWQVSPDRGFLMNPDPLRHLAQVESRIPEDILDQLESLAADLPALLENGRLRLTLDSLPVFDFAHLAGGEFDFRLAERLMMLYSYFASAYVFVTDPPLQRLPAGVAVPFVQLAHIVGRPPMFSYTSMVLGNWSRPNADQPIGLNNLTSLQTFTRLPDESWFARVHIAIEAQSSAILNAIQQGFRAVAADDSEAVHAALRAINWGLIAIIKTFHHMPEGCDPNVYYQQIRPYMFGFNDVIFEGVSEYGGKPQRLRGGSGAQSSVIPAVVAALGIRHQASELTQHLDVMKAYMPPAHRRFIAQAESTALRDYARAHPAMAYTYNACIKQMMTFRRAHFYYAKTYIFERSTNPVGTGGSMFMEFLTKLIAETEAHLI
jgi:Indoleamine 2,3-dioxygenase